jgi:hypothetical protein
MGAGQVGAKPRRSQDLAARERERERERERDREREREREREMGAKLPATEEDEGEWSQPCPGSPYL